MKHCKRHYFISNGMCLDNMRECVKENCNQWQPFTNYDRIRNMSVDEMAKCLADRFDCSLCPEQENRRNKLFFNEDCDGKCEEHCKQWLESEVDTE